MTNEALELIRNLAGEEVIAALVAGDTADRIRITADGEIQFGDGTNPLDVSLKRDASGDLVVSVPIAWGGGRVIASSDDVASLSTANAFTGAVTFNPAVGAPFAIGANAVGQLVAGLNVDQLDGQHGAFYSDASNLTGTAPRTVLPVFAGATPSVAGQAGAVPAPAAGEDQFFLKGDGSWATPADTGEVNTASNVNAAGTGVFKQKTGTNLEFRGIRAASSKLTVTLDAPSNEIRLDVDPAQLSIAGSQLTGTVPDARLSTNVVLVGAAQTVTGLKTFNRSGPPFALGASSTGQLVSGLNADQLDGQDGAFYSDASNLTGTAPRAVLPVFAGATAFVAGQAGAVPAPAAGEDQLFLKGDGSWAAASGGGGGEANTGANIGSAGTGVYAGMSGTVLQFHKLNALSNRISIALDGPNDKIDLDVVQSNLTIAGTQLSGTVPDARLSTNVVLVGTAQTVTGLKTFNRSGPPFALGASSTGQLVSGLNADQLDGQEGAFYSDASNLTGTAPHSVLPVFAGATALVAGQVGAVPAPAAGEDQLFLRGDGSWAAASGGGGGLSAGDTILAADGTAAAPGVAFNADATTGLFRVAPDVLGVSTGGVERARFNASGSLLINDTANTKQPTGGLTISEGTGAFNEILALKRSGVAHGMTALTETDTYGLLRSNGGPDGGTLAVLGVGKFFTGLFLDGTATSNNTTKSTLALAPVMTHAHLKSGFSRGAMGANANLFGIQDRNQTTVVVVDKEGDIWHDGTLNSFDTIDGQPIVDGELLRALELHRHEAGGTGFEPHAFDQHIRYTTDHLIGKRLIGESLVEHPALDENGDPMLDENGDPLMTRGLTNSVQLQNLLVGAACQTSYSQHAIEEVLEWICDELESQGAQIPTEFRAFLSDATRKNMNMRLRPAAP